MTKLSVNINKLATLRNARGKNNPDVVKSALAIVDFGAAGITVHPRPDERHIRKSDVRELSLALSQKTASLNKQKMIEFNIEGYPSQDFIEMVCAVRPHQVTLVPDPPDALTSNAGWRVSESLAILQPAVAQFSQHSIRVSVFVEPDTCSASDLKSLADIGVARVELYTEAYALAFTEASASSGDNSGDNSSHHLTEVIASYVRLAEAARSVGLGVNAGHDLDSKNLSSLIANIPWISEVSIGHALICEALYDGLEATVKTYTRAIEFGLSRSSQ
jgi:pyridoxine 5-phosphate synthase